MAEQSKPWPVRKQHWINQCNSSGCEVVLFDHRYTIWLSNKNWKEAERDGELLIKALESLQEHESLLAKAVSEARAEGARHLALQIEDMASERTTEVIWKIVRELDVKARQQAKEGGGGC